MSIFLSEEDLKEFLEDCIVCAEKWIRTYQEWEKTSTTGKTYEDGIKFQRQLSEKWKKQYAARYGYQYGRKQPEKKPELTVIQGGLYENV